MHILIQEPEGEGSIVFLDKNITSFEVNTEEDKGFSSARFQVSTINIDTRAIHNLSARNEIIAFVEGDIVWKGRIKAIQKSDVSLDIEGVGAYKVLEDDFYNDGSDEYLLVNTPVSLGTTTDFDLSHSNGARHVAVEVTNDLGYDVPLLDFTLTLRQFSDPAGEITPFVAITTNLDGPDPQFGFDTIVAQSTPKSYSPFFVNTISYDEKVPAGATFYVGIKTDAAYWAEADPSNNNIIKLEAENTGSPGNVWRYFNDTNDWVQTNYNADVDVTGRGKWDYSPGEDQEVILDDILGEAKTATSLNFNYALHNLASISRAVPYLKVPLESNYRQAIRKVLQQGDSNSKPLKLYVYGDYDNNTAYIEPIDLTGTPKAIIMPNEGYDAYGIDFSEVYTKVSAVFTDNDGAKSETTEYFTNSTQVPERKKILQLSNVTISEAGIIAELAASVAGEAKDNREFTVTEDNVKSLGGTKYPVHRIRAGDVIAVPNRVSGIVEDTLFWTKYHVRSTTYDGMEKRLRVDLSRKNDAEFLLELLGGN